MIRDAHSLRSAQYLGMFGALSVFVNVNSLMHELMSGVDKARSPVAQLMRGDWRFRGLWLITKFQGVNANSCALPTFGPSLGRV